MNTKLAEIQKLVTPPSTPTGLDYSWDVVEAELGLSLPDDYKEFIDLFGSGVLCGEIYVWNFRSSLFVKPHLKETLCGERSVLHGYERVRRQGGFEWPFEMYPEKGGLLPFATLYDVDNLNWLTEGPADRWDVVYWFSDGDEFLHLEGDSSSTFLLKLFRKEYERNEIPRFDEPYVFSVESS